jgi:uncharacterized phiE125 gp8 family phage protein
VRGYLTIETPPAVALLTTAEARDAVGYGEDDTTDADTRLNRLVASAANYLAGARGVLGRSLVNQSIRWTLPAAPGVERLALPMPRVQSVTAIGYVDYDGATQSLAAETYRLAGAGSDHAALELVTGAAWPATDDRQDAFWIDYVSGFGAAASDVPEDLRDAARLLVAHWDTLGRDPVITGGVPAAVQYTLDARIAAWRVPGGHF